MSRRRGRRWLAAASWLFVLFAMGVLAVFLSREGLARSDQWMGVAGGFIGFLGLTGLLYGRFFPRESKDSLGPPPHLEDLLLFSRDGKLPLVKDVLPTQMGVKRSIPPPKPGDENLAPYVPRAADLGVRQVIDNGGMALLHGRAAAGKSRTAFEAIRSLPNFHLIVPTNAQSLRRLLDMGYVVKNAVVWLDDLERYLTPDGFDVATLERLCPPNRRDVVVVATIRDEELARLHQATTGMRAGNDAVSLASAWNGSALVQRLEKDGRLIGIEQHLTDAERNSIGSAIEDPRIADALAAKVGFGEYLAGGPAMMNRWSIGEGRLFHVGRALICAAVDCRRAGFLLPIPQGLLAQLYPLYLLASLRGRTDLPTAEVGLKWACSPVLGTSSCLSPQEDSAYMVSDYLVDRTQAGDGPLTGLPVPDEVWHAVLRDADPVWAIVIGASAYIHERRDIAELAWRASINGGESWAVPPLWDLLCDQDRYIEAERLVRPAAESGESFAIVLLGLTLFQLGHNDEGEEWLRRGAEAGDVQAMSALSFKLEANGHLEETVRLLQSAAEAGDHSATIVLGELLADEGRLDEARQWWRRGEEWLRRAADSGDIHATVALGGVRVAQGRADEAESLLGRAVQAGDLDAMTLLSALLVDRGNLVEAERLLGKAAEAGDEAAMTMLGELLANSDRRNQAEQWWRRAADRGETTAMILLAENLGHGRESNEVEGFLRRAAEAGETDAMVRLSAFLDEQQRGEEGEPWLRRAAKRRYRDAAVKGDLDAMCGLGFLLASEDDEEGEYWLRRAAAASHPDAMNFLGWLLSEQQKLDEAWTWWWRAAHAGVPNAMWVVGTILKGEEGSLWLRRAADAGYEPSEDDAQ